VPGSVDYVVGYASLVGLREAYSDDVEDAPQPGRLRGFRRRWEVAMDNWEGGEAVKHFVDPVSGERPRIRVAYLDIYEDAGCSVNGLALPVDRELLEALDAREVNYERVELTAAFEPAGVPGSLPGSPRVFAYVGVEAARERCRQGAEDGDVFVSGDYVAGVRRAFAGLAPGALAEFDRTTDPLPFPERELKMIPPRRAGS
jgi:hypothetical protein